MFSPENRAKAEGLVERYPVKRSALLPLLHLVQYQDGFVSDDGIAECAELLELTKAEVAAVSTFYTMYKREPMGRHLVSVCTNFSCAVRGGKEVYDHLSAHLGVGHNQTTDDGAITLEHAECLGNCEGAPLVTVDYINYEMVGPDAAVDLVEGLRRGDVPEPTRGMIPPGIREASHRLAGIGPIDPEGPGQRLGLATAEHGSVPTPSAGPGTGAPGIISFTPTMPTGDPAPDEVETPTDPGAPVPADAGQAELSTSEAERIAQEASPSEGDPSVMGATAGPDEDPRDTPATPAADPERDPAEDPDPVADDADSDAGHSADAETPGGPADEPEEAR